MTSSLRWYWDIPFRNTWEMLMVKSWSVWHRRNTLVPNASPPKKIELVELGLVIANVLKGTTFFAWWIWLMTWWSEMDLKHSLARLISHSNDSQWRPKSWSMNGGWWWTFWLFLDTWGPTHAYLGTLPKLVKTRFLLLRQRGVQDSHMLEVHHICYVSHSVQWWHLHLMLVGGMIVGQPELSPSKQ